MRLLILVVSRVIDLRAGEDEVLQTAAIALVLGTALRPPLRTPPGCSCG
jgi:hypothetical protein